MYLKDIIHWRSAARLSRPVALIVSDGTSEVKTRQRAAAARLQATLDTWEPVMAALLLILIVSAGLLHLSIENLHAHAALEQVVPRPGAIRMVVDALFGNPR